MPIVNKSSKFIDNIYNIDVMQYGSSKITSSFLFFDGKKQSIIFDCGTSQDIINVINYLKKFQVPLESVSYLVPSHAHFDHSGGMWKLINEIKKFNPKVKIIATEEQKNELQNPSRHMKAARSTYGDFIGIMNPPKDEEFLIIEPDTNFHFGSDFYSLCLISTPGHTIDHVCPTLFKEGVPYFCFAGEAAGTNMNHSKILTLPTSMPIQFNYNYFINSLEKIIKLKPINLGLGHFGAVTGQSDVMFLLNDHKKFIKDFREFCREKFEEKGETRFVVEFAREMIFKPRSEYYQETPKIFQNNILALVYGMLVDLGFKQNKY